MEDWGEGSFHGDRFDTFISEAPLKVRYAYHLETLRDMEESGRFSEAWLADLRTHPLIVTKEELEEMEAPGTP